MKKSYRLDTLSDLDAVARQIWSDFGEQTVFLLSGNLGAGKTTLVRGICHVLDVEDEVVSPTYTIINEYRTRQGGQIYHIDLYRVRDLREAMETGIEDCLYSRRPCFVEWPDIITPVLPAKFVKLEITTSVSVPAHTIEDQSNGRIITAELYG